MPVKTEDEEMTSSLEMEMTSLTIQLLSLTQDLVTAKLRMETAAKVAVTVTRLNCFNVTALI